MRGIDWGRTQLVSKLVVGRWMLLLCSVLNDEGMGWGAEICKYMTHYFS